MNKHTKRKLCGLLALIAVNIAVIMALSTLGTSYAATTYKKGSSGDVVKTIQTKLKRWGYYTGDVDGIYGSLTVKAVKYFQGKNGLSADGVCGSATLKALGISSDSSGGGSSTGGGSSGSGSSNQSNDLYLMSRMISAEARGEPYIGQVAVGAVILNRVDHPSFPNTISGVIYQPGAFSALGDGQFNEPIADSAKKAAQDAMNGWDPTSGAIYYYNPVTATNKWIRSRPIMLTIGKHVFCK